MSGGRIVLLLLLCAAVSLADNSPKGEGTSPSTEHPALTGVSGVSGVADASTTPAASDSSVLTTTGGVLSSSKPTESTTAVDLSTSTVAPPECKSLLKSMTMDEMSICDGYAIRITDDSNYVLDLSGATQEQVDRLFHLDEKGYKRLKHSLLLYKSKIVLLHLSIEADDSNLVYVIKSNDMLSDVLLYSADISSKYPVRFELMGNKALTKKVIDAFKSKIASKKTTDSYFQDAGECIMKNEHNLNDFDDLKDCQYFYKDLVINQNTQGAAPERLPFTNISSGCLKIQGTALKNLNFLTNMTNMDIDCKTSNEITGNSDLCLNSETTDQLKTLLGSSSKIENNMECDDVCNATWALKMSKNDNVRCQKIVGDLAVTGIADVSDLNYLSNVVEIEGSLNIYGNSVEEFPFLSNLKRIKYGTGVKTLLFIHGNKNLTHIDLSNLKNVTTHPGKDDVSWLVVEENTPLFVFSNDEARRLKTFGPIRVTEEKSNITVSATGEEDGGVEEIGVDGGTANSGKGRTGTRNSGQKKEEGLSSGAIAGIVVAVVVTIIVVVGVAGVLIWVICRKKLTKAQRQEKEAMHCADYEKKAREAYARTMKNRPKREEPDAATRYQELQALKVTDLKSHFEELIPAEMEYFARKTDTFFNEQAQITNFAMRNTVFIDTGLEEANLNMCFGKKKERESDVVPQGLVQVFGIEFMGFLNHATRPSNCRESHRGYWYEWADAKIAKNEQPKRDDKDKTTPIDEPKIAWDQFFSATKFSWEDFLEEHVRCTKFSPYPYGIIDGALNYFLDGDYAKKQLVKVEGCYHFVGSLYGSIIDLYAILTQIDPSKRNKMADRHILPFTNYRYIFCGNYINESRCDIQLMVTLLVYARLYRDRMVAENNNEEDLPVVLLRGQNEFGPNATAILEKTLALHYTFTKEEQKNLVSKFMKVFNRLPTAALVNGKIFAVHGGFSRKMLDYPDLDSAFQNIPMPLPENLDTMSADGSRLLDDFLYSVPGLLAHPISMFGAGCFYNERMMRQFRNKFNIELVVRGRAKKGFAICMNNRLISLSSMTSSLLSKFDLRAALNSKDLYMEISQQQKGVVGGVLRMESEGKLTIVMLRHDFPEDRYIQAAHRAEGAAKCVVDDVMNERAFSGLRKKVLELADAWNSERCTYAHSFIHKYKTKFIPIFFNSGALQEMSFKKALKLYKLTCPRDNDYDLSLQAYGLYKTIECGEPPDDVSKLSRTVEDMMSGSNEARFRKDKLHYWTEAYKKWNGKKDEAKKEFARLLKILILTCDRKRRREPAELTEEEKKWDTYYDEMIPVLKDTKVEYHIFFDEDNKRGICMVYTRKPMSPRY